MRERGGNVRGGKQARNQGPDSGDSRREVCGGQNVTSWKYPHSADWILSSTAASVVT